LIENGLSEMSSHDVVGDKSRMLSRFRNYRRVCVSIVQIIIEITIRIVIVRNIVHPLNEIFVVDISVIK
jgi:hypothetical protein